MTFSSCPSVSNWSVYYRKFFFTGDIRDIALRDYEPKSQGTKRLRSSKKDPDDASLIAAFGSG